MAGDDNRQRTRRKHDDTDKGERRRRSQKRDDEKDDVATPPDKPPDLEALRKARLEYLEKSPEERSKKKMRYQYVRPTTTRAQSSKDARADGRSRVSVARRKSEEPRRARRRKDDAKSGSDADSETEYVYGRPGAESKKSEATSSRSRRSGSTTEKATRRKTTSKKATDERHPPLRRHTQPVDRESRPENEDRDHNIAAPCPPPTATLRRTPSSVVEPVRPPLTRSATTTRARTEVSLAKSSATSKHERRSSGIFSTLLAPKPPPPERKVSCLTCGADDIPASKSAKLPCSHRMCHSCLKRIFRMSVTDPAHMPPKCCTQEHIDLKHVDKLFDQSFKKQWNRKFLEYKTKNRIYCPSRGCSEWIKPNHITIEHGRKIGKCKHCGTRVCAICNNKAHTSRDCPKDPATKQFVEIAKQSGWQKCYNCSAMVELKEGCNHMTCRCTAEFCMVCGLKWKSCDCPWFNYEQVDAHLGNPARYQEELDRRRDQERRDEALARRMDALGIDNMNDHRIRNNVEAFGIGNAAGHHMNQNFIQQAREALTANYANAEQAARGLLNGWVTGRENRTNNIPGFPNHVELPPPIPRSPPEPHRRLDQRTQDRDRDTPPAPVQEDEEREARSHRPVRRSATRRASGLTDFLLSTALLGVPLNSPHDIL